MQILHPLLSDPETSEKLEALFLRMSLGLDVPDSEDLQFLEQPLLEAKALLAPYRTP
jgi:hypothetical protein